MKKIFMTTILVLASNQVTAIPFEPTLPDYSFPGSQFTVDAPANTFFADNYGITIDNAYLYLDGRDSFDGVGIANGEVSMIGTPQTGRITFLDTTDFVSIDYVTVEAATYTSYSVGGIMLDSFSTGPGIINDTYLFGSASLINYITWEGKGGFAAVSGLRYDYDGTTDGRNDDLNPVPEPTILAMLAMGLVGIGFSHNKKKAVS